MKDSQSVQKELETLFKGDYDQNREWCYDLAPSLIVERFAALFDNWENLDVDLQEKLLKIAVETILIEFPLDTKTIKFSINYIHLDPIRNAVLEKLNSAYLVIYYIRELAPNKTLYPDFVDHVKSALEKGVYANYSVEIANLLEIEIKPGQR